MNLPGLHLEWVKHRGGGSRLTFAIVAPIVGTPAFVPTPPTSKPAHAGTPMMTGGIETGGDNEWIVTGGSSLPYMTPPQVVKTYVPPYRYTIPSPISPLLAIGFGLNLAMFAADLLGVSSDGKEYYPGTDLEVVY